MWVQHVHIPLSTSPLSHPVSFLLSVIPKIHSSFPSWCLRHHLLVSLRVRPHKANLSPPHLQRINILCSAKYFIPALLFELKISGSSHQFETESHFFPPSFWSELFLKMTQPWLAIYAPSAAAIHSSLDRFHLSLRHSTKQENYASVIVPVFQFRQ